MLARAGVVLARWCRGCGKKLDISMFSVSDPHHIPECKYALDQLYALAKAQGLTTVNTCAFAVLISHVAGELEWFKEQKADDRKVQGLIKNYREFLKNTKSQGTKKTFSLARYKETLESVREDRIVDKGIMMTESQYLRFAQTHEFGPQLKLGDAKLQWDTWAKDLKAAAAEGVLSDMKNGERRFRVSVCTEVNISTGLNLKKSLELESKAQKAPDSEYLGKTAQLIFKDGHKFGASEASLDERLAGMVASGGTSSLHGSLQQIGDLKALAPAREESEDEIEDCPVGFERVMFRIAVISRMARRKPPSFEVHKMIRSRRSGLTWTRF